MKMWNYLKLSGQPSARKEAVIEGKTYRFTVLTPELIRMEYSEEGIFEDRATQMAIHREFPLCGFRVYEEENQLEIVTESIHLIYDKQRFSSTGLSVQVKGSHSAYNNIWYYGEPFNNLKGTARTLDESDGPTLLEDGLLSIDGFTIIDDSQTMVIKEDGWVIPRARHMTDLYFLGYGRNYLKCLKDFYRLSGSPPMIPRYALGNWWSRFYRYTDEEYRKLVTSFKEKEIPFSVAVLDMDWHLAGRDIDEKYGSGWTGYTWNKKLFPDPADFMNWLHEQGLHVTLNVHPADGVGAHEEMYCTMAKELGMNYEEEDKISFNISDKCFLECYFKYLHHPNEDMGVDFWWIDWQQKGGARTQGIDTLWMLNHFHFLDNGKKGMRPMTFSRYAGLGSHRYPLGFSGDTFATWETLRFQPYFTANASNAGFGWWSHDIGGHMHGIKDDEMAVRWLQFGVFSPIMRLHSSDNPFNQKEPWNYNRIAEETMIEFLKLRHRLIPYLYTMDEISNREGIPLIQPMYYHNSECEQAYEVPNEYYFGTSMIVCPLTEPSIQSIGMGKFKAWLPDGLYFDIFNGRAYKGNRRIDLYRDITTMPVLAKAGAIIPLAGVSCIQNAAINPTDMEIMVFAGDDGEFTLYEDNSLWESMEHLKISRTKFDLIYGTEARIHIEPMEDSKDVISEVRNYTFTLYGFDEPIGMKAEYEGGEEIDISYTSSGRSAQVQMDNVSTCRKVILRIDNSGMIKENAILDDTFSLLHHAQIEYDEKKRIYQVIQNHKNTVHMLGELASLELENDLYGALSEIIAAV